MPLSRCGILRFPLLCWDCNWVTKRHCRGPGLVRLARSSRGLGGSCGGWAQAGLANQCRDGWFPGSPGVCDRVSGAAEEGPGRGTAGCSRTGICFCHKVLGKTALKTKEISGFKFLKCSKSFRGLELPSRDWEGSRAIFQFHPLSCLLLRAPGLLELTSTFHLVHFRLEAGLRSVK